MTDTDDRWAAIDAESDRQFQTVSSSLWLCLVALVLAGVALGL